MTTLYVYAENSHGPSKGRDFKSRRGPKVRSTESRFGKLSDCLLSTPELTNVLCTSLVAQTSLITGGEREAVILALYLGITSN
jgi:hypothetical protein